MDTIITISHRHTVAVGTGAASRIVLRDGAEIICRAEIDCGNGCRHEDATIRIPPGGSVYYYCRGPGSRTATRNVYEHGQTHPVRCGNNAQ